MTTEKYLEKEIVKKAVMQFLPLTSKVENVNKKLNNGSIYYFIFHDILLWSFMPNS
jgi:hypothetical protein